MSRLASDTTVMQTTVTINASMALRNVVLLIGAVVMMFLIHVGFCTYEVGVARRKNHMTTLMKNAMVIPVVGVTFYLFGWWFYSAMVNGPGFTGGLAVAPFATPWSELMGAHMGGTPVQGELTAADTALWARLNGVFWAAFLLFSWTTASIVSGSIIERVKSGAFWLIAVMLSHEGS